MPVSNKTPYAKTPASGGTTYNFEFKIFEHTDLVVKVAGVLQTLGLHYVVTIVAEPGEGGSVVFQVGHVPAIGAGDVELERVISLERTTDYQESGGFRQAVVDKDFDRLIMMLQQLGRNVGNPAVPQQYSTVKNVKEFGAKAALGVDDWAAIQAAQSWSEANGHAPIFFPSGSYYISKPIIGSQFNWEGVYRQTYIKKTTNAIGTAPSRAMNTKVDSYAVDAILMIDHEPDAYDYSSSIKNLSLAGYGVTVNFGIYAPRTSRITIENVEALSVNFGFYTFNSWLGTLTRMRTLGGTNITFADDGSGGGTGTSMTFTGCYGQEAAYSFNVTGLAYSTLNSCAADFISGTAYQFISCHGITMNGCGTEQVSGGRVLNFDHSEITVNSFRALAVTGVNGKAQVKVNSGSYVFNSCIFPDYLTANGALNIDIGADSVLMTNNCQFPTNGNSYVNYTNGSVWVNNNNGAITRTDSNGSLDIVAAAQNADDTIPNLVPYTGATGAADLNKQNLLNVGKLCVGSSANPTAAIEGHNSLAISSVAFAGVGLNDVAAMGVYDGAAPASFVVAIDSIRSGAAEQVVNGGFGADANWTKGAGWSIAGGVAVANAAAGNLTQILPGLVVGQPYEVTFDAVVTAGKVKMSFGSGGVDRTESGTYTETRIATTDTLYFQPDPSFTGSIDNVTVKAAFDTFKWQKDGGAFTELIPLSLEGHQLANGVSILPGSISGHSLADQWTITIGEALNLHALYDYLGALKFAVDKAGITALYNTFTNASNYERLTMKWVGNTAYIGTDKAGTGSTRSLIFMTGGANTWGITAAGTFYPTTDNAISLGSAANRVANVFLGGYLNVKTGAAVASAGTIAPTGSIFHVTGANLISTISLPYAGFTGSIKIIPDAAFTTDTAGNIGLASVAVVGKVLQMTFDGVKWYPSY